MRRKADTGRDRLASLVKIRGRVARGDDDAGAMETLGGGQAARQLGRQRYEPRPGGHQHIDVPGSRLGEMVAQVRSPE